MASVQPLDYESVLAKVRTWPAATRLTFAQELLRALESDARSGGLRGVPVEDVRGIAAGYGQPPDDRTVARWLQEHRHQKYGS